ncbi:TetR/AcrR family transcriptional regulator [Zhouia sp. PK063]|uniref:TetR/AcrR family transcriptional regulator n=1 Tax=Zhouia sp. PK063 TaxID=3373602 RepID=UPI0037B22088
MRQKDPNKLQLIKEKTLDMIVNQGFENFGMQKLAKAASVSPATLYIYFNDKEHLILQVYEDIVTEMTEITLKNFRPEMPFSEGLRIQWQNRATYYLEHKSKMIFLEQIRHSSLNEKALEFIGTKFKDDMQAFVHNAIKNEEIVKVPVEVFWSIAYAPLYNLIRFHESGKSFMGNKFILDDEILDRTLEIVLKGLKP